MTDAPITYQWEPITKLLDEGLASIVVVHHKEVGVDQETVPLSVDWQKYIDKERAGIWKAFTCRIRGELAGYVAFHFHKPDRYQETLFIQEDTIFILPTLPNRGWLWVRLWQAADAEFKAHQPRPYKLQGKARDERAGRLLTKILGMPPIETIHSKVIT